MKMAIVDHSVIAGVTEAYLSNDTDFNENKHHIGNDESNISKDISQCNNEDTHSQKYEGSVEGNLRENVCNGISFNGENISPNLENVLSNKDPVTKIDYLDDGDNENKLGKTIEMEGKDKYLDSDDENNISKKIPSKRFMNLVDSDSEKDITYKTTSGEFLAVDEDKYSKHPQITKYKESFKIMKNIRKITDSESEDDEETSNIYNSPQISPKTTDITTNSLIDPESEEENETVGCSVTLDETDMLEIKNTKGKCAKKTKGSIRAAKSEAMHKIHSESQRLLRETGISLPYHRPKQRTLQEFLNRKKLSTSLPKAPSTAAKLKMSSAIVSRILEEKEKEAEHFYKSSDSEDDTHEVTSFTRESEKESSTTNEEQSVELICAQDTQNIDTSDRVSRGKKEIVQQDNTALTVDRMPVENDSCEANYHDNGHVLGLPLPKFTDDTLILDKEKLLPKCTSNSKFTLKGSPDMIIDLTDDAKPHSKGLNSLLDRFFCKHVIGTNKQTDNKSEVTVILLQDTQNGPIPVKEALPYKLPADTDNPELNKPGAKLMRLKEHLKLQMSLKRNEEWKHKETELRTQEKEMWNEEEEIEYGLDGLKKADILESSDSGESEPEEDDVRIEDKKRKKCLFADDEAEVTDNENSDADEAEEADEAGCSKQSTSFNHGNEKRYTSNSKSDVEEEETEDESNDTDDENENKVKNETEFMDENNGNVDNEDIVVVRNEKKRKRLIQKYQDDSEDENSKSEDIVDTHTSKAYPEDNDRTNENEQQPEVTTKSQMCKTPMAKTSMLDFVSPVTQLSILNTSFGSNKKEHSVDRHEFIFTGNTQSVFQSPEHTRDGIRNKAVSQKKLFYDIEEGIDDDYLMQLCSTKFESTPKSGLDLKSSTSQSVTTELHELDTEHSSARSTNVKELKSSSKIENQTSSQEKDLFDSSVCRTKKVEEVDTADSELKLRIVSSDDEEQSDKEDTFLKPKKRSAKRLDLSDSEEEDAPSCDEEDDNASDEETEEKYVDYDSEENEVVVVPKKDIQKVAADFLDEEAELSESDWDSADEDEENLDKLEFEEADEEHLDENELQNQVGKIHMKQVLDEDKREVRLLKELLFEDGDLHTDGAGRERKFKWRNIDKLGNDVEIREILENDGWVDSQEDEEEAKWNKLRHQRDKFLEERMKTLSNEIEDDLCDSQIFKFGLETLKKIKSNQKQDVSPDKVDLSENTEPILPRNIRDLLYVPSIGKKSQTIHNVIKRRSLLTRGEESLARIASLAKQSDLASYTTNKRNFVFQYIDPCVNDTSKTEETRKAKGEKSRDLPNQLRKRKVTSDFTSTAKKRRK